MISSLKTAYRIGFSSALNPESWSGYNELSRWKEEISDDSLRKSFLKGYASARVLLFEVRREMKDFLLAGEWNRDVT